MNEFLALQREADALARRLKEAGDTDGQQLVYSLCREMRALHDRLERIRWAVDPG